MIRIPSRRRPSRDLGPDTAQSHHQHGLPADFNHRGRRVRRPLPDLFLLQMMKILQVPGQHHQHGNDVLRDGWPRRVLRIRQDKIGSLRFRGHQAANQRPVPKCCSQRNLLAVLSSCGLQTPRITSASSRIATFLSVEFLTGHRDDSQYRR